MSDLLLLAIAALGLWLLFKPEKAPPTVQTHTFKVLLKKGDMEVRFAYEQNPILPNLERIIQRWALELDNPVNTAALASQLEQHIAPYRVVSLKPNWVVAATKPTKADRLHANLTALKEAAKVLDAHEDPTNPGEFKDFIATSRRNLYTDLNREFKS